MDIQIHWTEIIYSIFLIDAIGAVVVAWLGDKWWISYLSTIAQHFPAAKFWSISYLLLIIIIGHLIGMFDFLFV